MVIFLKSFWKNDCDSQREARRLAQERHLTIEDELDLEKIYLKSTIEDQKTKMFYLESRAQNYDYIAKQAKDSFWLFVIQGICNGYSATDFYRSFQGLPISVENAH